MHTRMLYRALHGSNAQTGKIVQDLSLPYSTVEKFVEYTSEEFGIWPLWLCPLRGLEGPSFHPTTSEPGPSEMLNIGLWGTGSPNPQKHIQQNRRLERKLTELGGRKILYYQTYYTSEEFWALYDCGWYEGLRQKHNATSLPSVYEKVKTLPISGVKRVLAVWPFAGIVGIYEAIRSRDYLLHRWPFWRREGAGLVARKEGGSTSRER